jgi:hypothetical protein
MTTPKYSQGPNGGPGSEAQRVVGSFSSYAEAERAVDRLSDNKFPVERTAIVGSDLKLVEQVVGRMTYLKAALRGALAGAVTGLLIGWLFAIFDWFDPLVARGWLILDGLWFGAVIGTLMGLLMHALAGGRRDFESFGGLQAGRYDVLVDAEVADEAARVLGIAGEKPATAESAAPAQSTPQTG